MTFTIINNIDIDIIVSINKVDFYILNDLKKVIHIILLPRESFNIQVLNEIKNNIKEPITFEKFLWSTNKVIKKSKSFSNNFAIEGLYINASSFTIKYYSEDIKLTKKEFLILYKLLSSYDNFISKDKLLIEIWGYDYYGGDHTIKSHISSLRRKIKVIHIVEIINIFNLGYKLQIKS